MTEYDSSGFQTQPERYAKIDEANRRSFLFHEPDSLQVIQSLHSVGPSRDQALGRVTLAGNMSPLNGYGPSELSEEERITQAQRNIEKFLYQHDVDPAEIRLLRPERDYTTPLSIVNLDAEPLGPDDTGLLRPETAGDFIYTHNPDLVLAARPADCPIVYVSAETPEGSATILLHLAWMGVAHGYIDQAKQALDTLSVDWDTVRVQITPGGHADSYKFTNFTKFNPVASFPDSETMFKMVSKNENDEGEDSFDFGIDIGAEVYEKVVNSWDVDKYQVFFDTTDTTSATAGYSSHSRASRGYAVDGDNTRDIVLALPPRYPKQNPERQAPPEILKEIKPVRVRYVDFNGNRQTATIEVHKDIAYEVKQFFEEAVNLGFPIERVVKSSDEAYGWDDEKLMADNTTSGFNYRLIKGTDKPSLHGIGRAFDVNTRLNPYIRYVDGEAEVDPPGAEYEPDLPGTLDGGHPLVAFMKKRGWQWGGDWTRESGRTDYQHFEKPL